jgi:hypothetical protein
MLLRVHFALIPYTKRNFWGWFVSLLINVFEGTAFNHVWLELKSENRNLAWDIVSWFSPWKAILPSTGLKYYVEDYCAEIQVTEEQWKILEKEANNLIGRRYAVLKLLMLSFARVFKLNWVAKLPGITCAEGVATVLKSVKLYTNEPGMAGLVEIDLQTTLWNKVF